MSSIEPVTELAAHGSPSLSSLPSPRRGKAGEAASSPRRRAFLFGFGALAILGGFGALIAFRKHHLVAGGSIGGVGGAVFLLSLVSPSATLYVRTQWLRFASVLGWVNSRILLTVIFFVLLSPLALFRRLTTRSSGNTALDLRWRNLQTGRIEGQSQPSSDWRASEPSDPKHYEHPW